MDRTELERMMKQVMLKDMRINCRLRGLSPAGGKEQLTERLVEHMMATGDYTLKTEDGSDVQLLVNTNAGMSTTDMNKGNGQNNYVRPSGQNVGNFMTDRNSSRVLAPPGGGSSISFGDDPAPTRPQAYVQPPPQATPQAAPQAPSPSKAGTPQAGSLASIGMEHKENNYARPNGQNVGNFMTERHMVKIVAPPGGMSQITFG